MNDTVQVLLATFNGERFLREQIDSLLSQTHRPLQILARDDGSTDGTRAILAEYAQRHPGVFRLAPPSPPTGSARDNFGRLIELSTAPYLAFADQDDVWHPEKLTRSLAAMGRLEQKHGPATPLLVFSDLSVVDDQLRVLHSSLWRNDGMDPGNAHRLPRLLVQNVVTGCTALINRPLGELARRTAPGAFLHDGWIALLSCCFGASEAIAAPLVQYRQHGRNVVGAVAARPSAVLPAWRRHGDRLRQLRQSTHQAAALLRSYGDRLDPSQRSTVEALALIEDDPSRVSRVLTALRQGFRMNSLRRTATLLWLLWDLKAAQSQRPT